MRYLILLIFVIFVLILFGIDEEKISKKIKILIIAILFVVAVFGYFYEANQKNNFNNLDRISKAFSQGKVLICNGYEVDERNFNFSYATQSFIAKKEAQTEFKNVIVQIKDCELKDE